MRTTQPRKQRKMLYNAPLHVRYRHFSAHLSPTLKATHLIGSVPVRKGDTVKIMRGDRKGVEGKVATIDRQKYRLFVEGVTREKVDGTTIPVAIHPSKVVITALNLDDKWRRESLKTEAPKEVEKPAEEAAEKKTEKPKRKRETRKPRKAAAKKPRTTRKRKMTTSEKEQKGAEESG